MTNEASLSLSLDFRTRSGPIIRSSGGEISLPAGRAGTWILTLENTGEALPAGTELAVERWNIQFAGKLQDTHPLRRDYVTSSFDGDGEVTASIIAADRGFTVRVDNGVWAGGERLVIRMGDTSGGGPGSEVFWSTTRGRLSVSVARGGERRPAGEDLYITVVHRGEIDLLRVLGPTTVRPETDFDLHLIAFDANRNVIDDFSATVSIECDGPVAGLPLRAELTPADGGVKVINGLSFEQEGVYRFTASVPGLQDPVMSNPVVCRSAGLQVYWGDLHNHGWGDSTMLLMHDRISKLTPQGRHEQAQRIGRFDYAAVGAMSMPDTEERTRIWEDYGQTVQRMDAPGRYVPFLGMEMHPPEGDRMLFFKDHADAPLPMRTKAVDLYEAYGARPDAILECHIGGQTPKHDQFLPPNEKMVEVTSAFGNAEWLMQDMLSRGFRPAVTGASDLHLGLLGAPRAVETFRGRFGYRSRLGFRDSGFGSGPIGAAAAPELTREALWRAFEQRSGYATTGDRIFLEIDAGGYGMGAVADLTEPFMLRVTAHGETEIERIDLIVGKCRAASLHPGARDYSFELRFDRDSMPPGAWFYLRVREVNNEYAWSAPIWFADGETRGDTQRHWPAWNETEKPEAEDGIDLQTHLRDLEEYLDVHGDREAFGDIEPIGVRRESMGTSALFVSLINPERYPVSIRWFYEFEIPKIRVDWGYEAFGVVNCETGPV